MKFQESISEMENRKYFKKKYKSKSERLARGILEFAREYKKQQQEPMLRLLNSALLNVSLVSPIMEIPHIVSNWKKEMTPAGHFHLAMMFGPLIFESGVPK